MPASSCLTIREISALLDEIVCNRHAGAINPYCGGISAGILRSPASENDSLSHKAYAGRDPRRVARLVHAYSTHAAAGRKSQPAADTSQSTAKTYPNFKHEERRCLRRHDDRRSLAIRPASSVWYPDCSNVRPQRGDRDPRVRHPHSPGWGQRRDRYARDLCRDRLSLPLGPAGGGSRPLLGRRSPTGNYRSYRAGLSFGGYRRPFVFVVDFPEFHSSQEICDSARSLCRAKSAAYRGTTLDPLVTSFGRRSLANS